MTIAVAIALVTTNAHAEDVEAKALAEALFQDGRTLLDGGHAEEACAKFTMSYRIEPKLGTLLNLATCHEKIGKTATAWAEFTEAITRAARANESEREQFAREHAAGLAPQLSRIAISASDPGLPLTVSIDDVSLNRAALDTSFPVDPGEHALVVRSLGRRAWTYTVTVPNGPALTPIVVPALPLDDDVTVADASQRGSHRTPQADQHQRSRTPMWIAFGTAIAAASVGTYFGFAAFAQKADARAECDGPACSQRGLDLFARSKTFAHVSTISISFAVVAAGVGVYLGVRGR